MVIPIITGVLWDHSMIADIRYVQKSLNGMINMSVHDNLSVQITYTDISAMTSYHLSRQGKYLTIIDLI